MSLCISTNFRELLVLGSGLPAGAGGRILRGLAEARLHHALQRGLRRGLQGLHHLPRIRPSNHQAETREQALLFSILSFNKPSRLTTIFAEKLIDGYQCSGIFFSPSAIFPSSKYNRQSITDPLRFIHLRTAGENLI